MIKEIYMFTNGAVTCLDEKGENIPEQQTNVFTKHLLSMKEAGLIDGKTIVFSNHTKLPALYWLDNGAWVKERYNE